MVVCRFVLVSLTLAVILSACGDNVSYVFASNELRILENVDRVEIISLDPPVEGGDWKPDVTETHFYGFKIHQRAEVKLEDGKRLVGSFLESVRNGDKNMASACFIPHHAIRVWAGEDRLDIVVCFMCHNFVAAPTESRKSVHLTDSVAHEWREVFKAYEVKTVE